MNCNQESQGRTRQEPRLHHTQRHTGKTRHTGGEGNTGNTGNTGKNRRHCQAMTNLACQAGTLERRPNVHVNPQLGEREGPPSSQQVLPKLKGLACGHKQGGKGSLCFLTLSIPKTAGTFLFALAAAGDICKWCQLAYVRSVVQQQKRQDMSFRLQFSLQKNMFEE